MRKKHILLAMTGSVAATVYNKLIEELSKLGEVKVVITEKAKSFLPAAYLDGLYPEGAPYTDSHEWTDSIYMRGDNICHIDLRKWADILVIAPLSMNTLAKISNGICDNLLTSIVRAWDFTKPCVLVPACNTLMYEHPLTSKQLNEFKGFFKHSDTCKIVEPIVKTLACGDTGVGAMAEIKDITSTVKDIFRWKFPLISCSGIPFEGHPGSFGYKRSWYTHTGIDLYTADREPVYAVENGVITIIDDFTGTTTKSDWWEDTKVVCVEGPSGVVVYGEISPMLGFNVGQSIYKGQKVGVVKRVLKKGKERPDIPGHSLSMLHLELLSHGCKEAGGIWNLNEEKPCYLHDPTVYLVEAPYAPANMLKMGV